MTPLLAEGRERALLQAQGLWLLAGTAASSLLYLSDFWARQPHLAVSAILGVGAALASRPGRLWAPLVFALVLASGWSLDALGGPAALGAGAACGVVAARTAPWSTRRIDVLNSALAGAAGAGFALVGANQLVPQGIDGATAALLTGGLLGLGGSIGHLPSAIEFSDLSLPSARQIRRELELPFREAPSRALVLFAAIRTRTPEPGTLTRLAEVTRWVFELQLTAQTLTREAANIDVDTIHIRLAKPPTVTDDAFLREREQATATHLRRILDHHSDLLAERQRVSAIVDYALAYLEEARINLTLASHLPAELSPANLDDVLTRLRDQAVGGRARRATAREITG